MTPQELQAMRDFEEMILGREQEVFRQEAMAENAMYDLGDE